MDTLSEKSPNQGENPYPNDERYSTKASPSSASSGSGPSGSPTSDSTPTVQQSTKQDHSNPGGGPPGGGGGSLLQLNGDSNSSAKLLTTTKQANNIPATVVNLNQATSNCSVVLTTNSSVTERAGGNGRDPGGNCGSGGGVHSGGVISGGGLTTSEIQIQETRSLTSTSPIPPAGSIVANSEATHMVNGHANGGGVTVCRELIRLAHT